MDPVTRTLRPVGATAPAGALIAAAGLVAWGLTIGLQPALTAAGFAAMAGADLPSDISSGTQLVLLLGAHDLRLAALIAVAAGVSLLVAGVPRLAARPGPPLAAVAGVVLVANLAWGLAGADVLTTVASTVVVGVVAARAAATRWPAHGTEVRTDRALRLGPALVAAGAGSALVGQPAAHPALLPFVPAGYPELVTAVRVLLVVAAVACAVAVGHHRRGPRIVAGTGTVLLAAAAVGDDRWAAPATGLLGAAVLVLAWTGEDGGHRARQALGLVVAAAVPVLGGVALLYLGLVPGAFSLILTGAEIGADGLPMIGTGLLLGAVFLTADAVSRP